METKKLDMNQQDEIKQGTTAFLKKLREQHGYQQQEVAKKLPYNLAGYNQIEKGRKFLTIVQIWQLARLYDVTPADIINGIYGVDPSEEKAKVEKLQALLDATLEKNSILQDKIIGLLEGKP